MENRYIKVQGSPAEIGEDRAHTLALTPFQGLTPYEPGTLKEVWLMHGVPGARKTTSAHLFYQSLNAGLKQHTTYIAADEHGAGDAIEEYAQALNVPGLSRFKREELGKQFRAATNFIYSHALEIGLRNNYHLVIDTTCSGDTGRELLNALKAVNAQINMRSYYAPLGICVDGALNRTRQASFDVFLQKRIDALGTFDAMAQAASTLSLFFSDAASRGPMEVLRMDQPGHYEPLQRDMLKIMRSALLEEGRDLSPLRNYAEVTFLQQAALKNAGREIEARLGEWVPRPNPVRAPV